MNLNSPIREIKGIGVKTEQLFQQLGVYTVGDILLYFPRDYEKYPALCEVEQLLEDRKNALYICVKKSPTVNTHSRQQVALLDVKGETKALRLIWFRSPYIRSLIRPGGWYVFYGKVPGLLHVPIKIGGLEHAYKNYACLHRMQSKKL